MRRAIPTSRSERRRGRFELTPLPRALFPGPAHFWIIQTRRHARDRRHASGSIRIHVVSLFAALYGYTGTAVAAAGAQITRNDVETTLDNSNNIVSCVFCVRKSTRAAARNRLVMKRLPSGAAGRV